MEANQPPRFAILVTHECVVEHRLYQASRAFFNGIKLRVSSLQGVYE